MIFDYRTKTFIDDGRNDRLTFQGLIMLELASVEPAQFMQLENAGPTEQSSTKMEEPVLMFQGGILKVFSGGDRVRTLNRLFFLMNESEVSAAQRNLYSRSYESAGEAIAKKTALSDIEKKAIQKAIDDLAVANGIVLPENMNYFNDRLILYMYPFIRSFANSETNFHKILEDMKHFTDNIQETNAYRLPFDLFDHSNINDFLKEYLGTGSKEITKFIASRFIVKTDLVKSLSPELLTLLVNNSSKIFGISTETKILTCYQDMMFDVITYVRYIMDIFDGNVDHTQKYLASKENFKWTDSDKKIMSFLRSQFSPQKRMKIMTEIKDFDNHLRDVAEQVSKYDTVDKIPYKLRFDYPEGLRVPKNWKTFKELHDKVSAEYNRIKAEDNNKTIPYSEVEWGIHGMRKDNVELVLPSEGKTLVEWGSVQEHCVASYADRAANKECIIMGVKVDGVHKYTVELRIDTREIPVPPKQIIALGLEAEAPVIERKIQYSFRIQQFYAKNNRHPEDLGDKTTKPLVRELLKEVFQCNEEGEDIYSYRLQFQDAAGIEYGRNDARDALAYAAIAIGDQQPAIINDAAAAE